MSEIVLASASPRRLELLKYLLPDFKVIPSNVDEKLIDGEEPRNTVIRLASEKARSVFDSHKKVTIGADTIVVLENKILGKPKDAQDAIRILTALRNRSHSVITGVAIVNANGKLAAKATQTELEFRDYSTAEMESYVATGDPMDKAGAYAIQQPQFHPAKRITGCYFNVVGLPLCTLGEMLRDAGVSLNIKKPSQVPDFCLLSKECPISAA
ncbi:MAG: septum formation protein Maf [Dehalococcoidia bacterium]|nr:septum formation protein Maf [Dehalococcoidia bacterium]